MADDNTLAGGGLPPPPPPKVPFTPLGGAQPPSKTGILHGLPTTAEDAKKGKTSRISLSSTKDLSADLGAAPKLRSPLTPLASAPSPIQPPPMSATQQMASKSKTSRISLESAFGASPAAQRPAAPAESDPATTTGPRTIRLKRPSSDMTGSVINASSITPPPENSAAEAGNSLPPGFTPITQSLESPAPAAEETALDSTEEEVPTRKKTIKIKRPGAGGRPKISLNTNNSGEPLEGAGEVGSGDDLSAMSLPGGMQPIAAKGPDKVNPVFIIAAIIAFIIAIDLAWVYAAQAFGPNGAAGYYTTTVGPNVATPPGLSRVEIGY